MGTIKATNIEPIADNGTVTLGSSGDTITVPTGVTVGGGMSNTPNFSARGTSAVSISTGVFTKITFNIEQWDIGSGYDLSNNKFVVPTGFAGKYWFQATTEIAGIDQGEYVQILFYKNGSSEAGTTGRWYAPTTDKDVRARTQVFLNLSVGDEIEVYVQQNEGSTRTTSTSETFFKGYRLITE